MPRTWVSTPPASPSAEPAQAGVSPPRCANAPTTRAGRSEPPAYAAPARRTDLGGLPPAWIGGGELDLFLDEDVDYAVRLRAAGVPCQLDRVPGMYHGADVHLAETSALMRAFRQRMLDALEAAIGADLNRGSGRVSRFGGHGHADRAHWVAQTAPPSSRGEP